eukprot:6492801-Amphidinium_carterae.2
MASQNPLSQDPLDAYTVRELKELVQAYHAENAKLEADFKDLKVAYNQLHKESREERAEWYSRVKELEEKLARNSR